jgi:hypothetical protein
MAEPDNGRDPSPVSRSAIVIQIDERRAIRDLAKDERRKVEQVREMARREQPAFPVQRDYGDESDKVDGTRDGV